MKVSNKPSKEDAKILAGKSESYIRGWNMVKYRNRRRTPMKPQKE